MQTYTSLSSKKSGVIAFDNTDTSITVKFRKGVKLYEYNVADNGGRIATMIKLAHAQKGLSTYIAKHRDVLKFTNV